MMSPVTVSKSLSVTVTRLSALPLVVTYSSPFAEKLPPPLRNRLPSTVTVRCSRSSVAPAIA